MQLPNYILISGLHVEEQDPFSGIFNTQKQTLTTDEILLCKKLKACFKNNESIISLAGYPDINFESLPFTGTIDCEIQLFIE